MHAATEEGRQHTAIVKILLDHGADPNIANEEHGQTPLHLVAMGNHQPEKLNGSSYPEGFHVDGVNPNIVEESDDAATKRREMTNMLIDKGADPNAQDRLNQSTPLHLAAKYNH